MRVGNEGYVGAQMPTMERISGPCFQSPDAGIELRVCGMEKVDEIERGMMGRKRLLSAAGFLALANARTALDGSDLIVRINRNARIFKDGAQL